ncbi:MAG: phage tail sheath subtilisin-like domain-containing protein [Steroidobacteraceae bacterium]
MPQYQAPGVYIEEIGSGPKPIEGVSTSIAGAVGVTAWGPTREPVLVTSFHEFQRRFGAARIEPSVVTKNAWANDTVEGGEWWHFALAVKGFFDNGGQRLYVQRVCANTAGTAFVELCPGLTVKAKAPGSYGNSIRVRAVSTATAQMELTVQHLSNGALDLEEIFTNSTIDDAAARVSRESTLIDLQRAPCTDVTLPPPGTASWQWLAGGNDRFDQLALADFVGIDGGNGSKTGIRALADIHDISLCIVPGLWARTVHNALIEHCAALQHRFAIIDPPAGLDVAEVCAFREVYDTLYAALYYPWLEMPDPTIGQNVRLAPSAHVAGIYARADAARGVHKAPANEVITSLSRLARTMTADESETLNEKNINALRFFSGRGYRVWGARCLTSDPDWKYVHVRRLLMFIEQSIERGTQWVVFEPNAETTWTGVRNAVTNFLRMVWRNGALHGTTEDEAFFVKCDRSTMTQNDIDNGRLICLVGIAPLSPAEFVIIRIGHWTTR